MITTLAGYLVDLRSKRWQIIGGNKQYSLQLDISEYILFCAHIDFQVIVFGSKNLHVILLLLVE